MTPYHISERAIFYNGDNRVVMAEMEDNSVDSVVCDPPYEIGFMQRGWDSTGIAYEVRMWQEALRVLKPGGHLLAFGGSRTYHRLACAIEDAGFEIRDQIMYVYGSGFPKSLNISKIIDKMCGNNRETEYDPNDRNSVFGKGMGGGEWNASSDPPVSDMAKEWDGVDPLCTWDDDKFFWSDSDLMDYCEEYQIQPQDMQLVFAEPVYGRYLDSDYFCDELHEDGDLPDSITEAMDKFNEVVKAAGPLSWRDGKIAAIIPEQYKIDLE